MARRHLHHAVGPGTVLPAQQVSSDPFGQHDFAGFLAQPGRSPGVGPPVAHLPAPVATLQVQRIHLCLAGLRPHLALRPVGTGLQCFRNCFFARVDHLNQAPGVIRHAEPAILQGLGAQP